MIKFKRKDFRTDFKLIGRRGRHLYDMVKKGVANGLGPDFIPLPDMA